MEQQTIIADGRYRTDIDPKLVQDMRYIGPLIEYLLTRRIGIVPYRGVYKIVHDTSTMPQYAGLYAYGSYESLIDDINTHVKSVIERIKKLEPDYDPSFLLQLRVDWLQLTLHCTLKGVTVQSSEFLTNTGFMDVSPTDAVALYERRLKTEIDTLMQVAASRLAQL